MNTRAEARAKWMLYKELELIPDSWEEPKWKRLHLSSWLSRAWSVIVDVVSGHSEPRIWSSTDKTGMIWWHTYDPISNESGCFSSESEVRAWLERRYYHHNAASPFKGGVSDLW
ncbi:hypothetical protein H6G89_04620 [Oscillatoria sp. FACHB-1407]|uniref:hypothetical protein n=1 Tax=Oscillatoria sp. FACHB-1407 TaxID=2692847 RepID=UPI0016865946|nr:hypothetical protein [Oscillatoria sp. FACHB-1407]MBD2460321.1 hypothetical protein [Oscillatoria sp. FACHB-1407]